MYGWFNLGRQCRLKLTAIIQHHSLTVWAEPYMKYCTLTHKVRICIPHQYLIIAIAINIINCCGLSHYSQFKGSLIQCTKKKGASSQANCFWVSYSAQAHIHWISSIADQIVAFTCTSTIAIYSWYSQPKGGFNSNWWKLAWSRIVPLFPTVRTRINAYNYMIM